MEVCQAERQMEPFLMVSRRHPLLIMPRVSLGRIKPLWKHNQMTIGSLRWWHGPGNKVALSSLQSKISFAPFRNTTSLPFLALEMLPSSCALLQQRAAQSENPWQRKEPRRRRVLVFSSATSPRTFRKQPARLLRGSSAKSPRHSATFRNIPRDSAT